MLFSELSETAKLGRAEFLKRFPNPLLISAVGDDDKDETRFETPDHGSPIGEFRRSPIHADDATPINSNVLKDDETLTEDQDEARRFALFGATRGPPTERDEEEPPPIGSDSVSLTLAVKLGGEDGILCLPIVKSTRNPFGQMITVGRTPNNDLVVRDTAVSKFHAYFSRQGSVLFLHDHDSTNGTYVGRRKIDSKGIPLENGARVSFGQAQKFRFYTPEGIFQFITKPGT
jgi:hypothetical protein